MHNYFSCHMTIANTCTYCTQLLLSLYTVSNALLDLVHSGCPGICSHVNSIHSRGDQTREH